MFCMILYLTFMSSFISRNSSLTSFPSPWFKQWHFCYSLNPLSLFSPPGLYSVLSVWNGFPPDRHKPFSIFLLCQHLKHLVIPVLKGQQTQCCFSPAVSYNCPYIYHVEANWLLALLPLGVIGYIRSQSQEKKLRTLHPEINQKQNIINKTYTHQGHCV